MNKRLNIIVFGVDRCPQLCRPGLERFISSLCVCADIYIGLISLQQQSFLENEQQNLENWACDITSRNQLCTVKICQTFSQANPSYYYNRDLLDKSLDRCMSRLDIFYNEYKSIRNYMNYLYYSYCFSKGIACFVEDGLTLLLRPDMLYGGLSLDHISALMRSIESNHGSAFLLAHDSFGFVNDRFFVSSAKIVIAYMQRIVDLDRYLFWPWRYFHSEMYASWFIRWRLNLQVNELPVSVWGKRVRANEQILNDSNFLTYAIERRIYAKMFARHSYWQLKLSLKKCMNWFRPA